MNAISRDAFLAAFLTFLICWCGPSSVGAQESSKIISLSQTPAAVQKTIAAQVADAKLGEIEQSEETGEITYTVNFTKGSVEREFTVGAGGMLIRVELALGETPSAVQSAIKAQVGAGQIESIERTFEEGKIGYEVEMTRKNGTTRSFTVAPDGKVISLQLNLEETPSGVRKTIVEHQGNAELIDIFRNVEDGEVSYYVEISRHGKERDFTVAESGKLESVHVFLGELPPQAQKTINEKLAGGKIKRIDKTFEPRMGVPPFEVEAIKDGSLSISASDQEANFWGWTSENPEFEGRRRESLNEG